MDDLDVIAYLFAADGVSENRALDVIYMAQNQQHFLPPRQCPPPKDSDLASQDDDLNHWEREAIEPPEERVRDDFPHHGPYLVFRFSKLPKTRKGLVCGHSLHADIVTPENKGISRYHLSWPLTTRTASCVSKHAEPGFNIDVNAEEPGLLQEQPPTIKILDNLQFKLVVPRHDTTSDAYLANVKRFREGSAETEDLLADMEPLSLRRPSCRRRCPVES